LLAQNLRVVYDKNGKKMVSKEGGSNIEDPAGFFANVFGGERFIDYVRPSLMPLPHAPTNTLLIQIGEISLMKDMTSVANTMLSEEEKEKEKADAAAVDGANPNASTSTAAPSTSTSTSTATDPHLTAPRLYTPSPPSDDTARPSSLYGAPPPTSPAAANPTGSVSAPSSPQTGPSSSSSKKRTKLTPEQREKLAAHDRERKRALEARVRMLTDKLIERLRPFVNAKDPGAQGDPETAAWEAKMRREAEDLKVESFGVEILHTIGTVYVTKASGYLKSKRFLGL
jgi:hypothetical protein